MNWDSFEEYMQACASKGLVVVLAVKKLLLFLFQISQSNTSVRRWIILKGSWSLCFTKI